MNKPTVFLFLSFAVLALAACWGGPDVDKCPPLYLTNPVCPPGCSPGMYWKSPAMNGGHWECDPDIPGVTCPLCASIPGEGVGGMTPSTTTATCRANGVDCLDGSECCSGLCSEPFAGLKCEACKMDLEGCVDGSECCSGVCSLNACGG